MKPTLFLSRVLLLDGVTCAVFGLLLLVDGPVVAEMGALPLGLLRGAGAMLLPCAALLLWMSRRASLPIALVWAVIALNIGWVVDSVALLELGWIKPNGLGMAFVLAQAAAVAAVAVLEYAGLRRSSPVLA